MYRIYAAVRHIQLTNILTQRGSRPTVLFIKYREVCVHAACESCDTPAGMTECRMHVLPRSPAERVYFIHAGRTRPKLPVR